jgi:preprotein translocase subunit YajC
MVDTISLMAQAAPSGGQNALWVLLPQMLLVVGIFYVLLILPMRSKQKKLEALIKSLKPRDRVIINPGIIATIVAVEDDSLLVRLDEKATMRVLKNAVAGPYGPQTQTGDDKEK